MAVHVTHNHRQEQSPEWAQWQPAWCPWLHLRKNHPDVEVYDYELPDGIAGWTDADRRVIWIAPGAREQRRVAAAEQVCRLEMGSAATDLAVTMEAAARLLPLPDVASALRWSGRDMAAAAAELGVDEGTLQVRIDMLSGPDRAELDRRIRPRHLAAVPATPAPQAQPREVHPDRAAIAYTADRGWHMTEAPPEWLLDILAEVED